MDKVIVNSRTLQRVMSYAAAFNALIACRPSDPWLTEGAVAASGELATRLGLSGSPPSPNASVWNAIWPWSNRPAPVPR